MLTAERTALAAEIKVLREDGMTWASIARVTGLPGPSAPLKIVTAMYGTRPRPRARVVSPSWCGDFGWLDHAACKDRTSFFFSENEDDQAEAERICLTECPVLAQCQQWRKATRPSAGVWAGRAYARQ